MRAQETAMDVDEDEEATQRPRHANDYGIVVDFDVLDEDEKEVRFLFFV